MNDRYVILPMCFVEEEDLFVSELRVLPFQIEAYLEASVSYLDEDGMPHDHKCIRIFTKSGAEFDILLTLGEFEKMIAY